MVHGATRTLKPYHVDYVLSDGGGQVRRDTLWASDDDDAGALVDRLMAGCRILGVTALNDSPSPEVLPGARFIRGQFHAFDHFDEAVLQGICD